MPSSVSADAVRAAVAAGAELGVVCTEPTVLADGANVIVYLRPSPVVAKVAATTPALRADVAAWLRRELDLALFLADAGAPAMVPSREVPATVHRLDKHVMSFWTYLEPSGAWPPDEATVGAMLRDLHAVLRTSPAELPAMTPLGDIPAFLARPQTVLSATGTCRDGCRWGRACRRRGTGRSGCAGGNGEPRQQRRDGRHSARPQDTGGEDRGAARRPGRGGRDALDFIRRL